MGPPTWGMTSIDETELAKHPYVEGETYAELFPEHESGRTAHGVRDDNS